MNRFWNLKLIKIVRTKEPTEKVPQEIEVYVNKTNF
jgi:hypothetical protein